MVDFGLKLRQLKAKQEAQHELDFRAKFVPTKLNAKNLKLWEGSVHPDCCDGKRFCHLEREPMKGFPLSYRYFTVKKDPTQITEHEKEFWTSNDKSWAWHCYLAGSEVEMICEFVGGKKEDFVAWVKQVCRGEETCIYSGSFRDAADPNGWKPRHNRMLWLMYQSRVHFLTTCRLLGKNQDNVRARVQILKEQNGPKP